MTKKLCQCIGLASLILVVNYNDLLNFGQNMRTHAPFPLTAVCIGQLLAIIALGLILFALRVLIDRTPFHGWAQFLLMMLVPPYLIERARPLIPFAIPDGVLICGAVVWMALLLLFLLQSPKTYRLMVRLGDAAGIFAATFALFSIVQILVVMTWRPGPQTIEAAWSKGPQAPRQHPKVVWIVFDELSYDQVFEHRAHDLTLNNFDALRSQSTLYTNMQPVGLKTAEVIPSLLSGRVIDEIHFKMDNKLLVHYAGEHGKRKLDGAETIFHDAQTAGWRTDVVGWYNPYCPIYGNALDSCYWSFLDRLGMDMRPTDSAWTVARKPFSEIALQLYSPAALDREYCDIDVQQHLASERDLEAHTEETLQDDQADFIFLHLPIPHSPNIWSRVNDNYVQRCGSSYLDNLALADKVLGKIMSQLEQSPRWKDTTVIVQGDHSWRVMLWEGQPAWTDEDDQASHDKFDPRPALLIHNAGQTQPLTDGRALSLLFVHQALEDVLQHEPVPAPPSPATAAAVHQPLAGESFK